MHTSRFLFWGIFSLQVFYNEHALHKGGESLATALHNPQDEILKSLADPGFFKSQTPHPLPTLGQNESCVPLVPQDKSKLFGKKKNEEIAFV